MRYPKVITVGFQFSGGFDVITSYPFSEWNVYQHHRHMATYQGSGRKNVTKKRALRILKLHLTKEFVKLDTKNIDLIEQNETSNI